jgi:hypothetical protein
MTSPVARCDAGAARLPTFAREEKGSARNYKKLPTLPFNGLGRAHQSGHWVDEVKKGVPATDGRG